jgi:hypothetical protein
MSPISSRNRVPPCACSKRPLRWLTAPVNAPFSWPNSSDSSRFSGSAAQLSLTSGCGARRVVVNGAGDQFLAGAGFAADQHRGVPLRHLPHLLEHPLHRLAVADHAVETVLAAHRAPQAVALGGQRPALALHLAGIAHAAGDQVGDHLQKAGALLQPFVAAGRLRRQHAAVLPGPARIGTPMNGSSRS